MSKEEFVKAHGEKYAYIWDRVQAQLRGDTMEGGVGNMKLEMEEDAEHMSKAEFIKTHGERYAYIWDRVRKDMEGDPRTNEGRVKDWLLDMEADAAEMSKEEFIKAHGENHADIWDRVQKEMSGDYEYMPEPEFESTENDTLNRIKKLAGL
jgi:hypothetical protein